MLKLEKSHINGTFNGIDDQIDNEYQNWITKKHHVYQYLVN